MKCLGWANDEKIAAAATWNSSTAAVPHRTEPEHADNGLSAPNLRPELRHIHSGWAEDGLAASGSPPAINLDTDCFGDWRCTYVRFSSHQSFIDECVIGCLQPLAAAWKCTAAVRFWPVAPVRGPR